MPKEKAPSKCLSIIMIDSVIKANKKYYPQTLLQECKYVQEEIKTKNYIVKIQTKVTLMMRQNVILIVMKITNNLFFKAF